MEGRRLTAGSARCISPENGSAAPPSPSPTDQRLRRWGVPAPRIEVVPNGIDLTRFRFHPVARLRTRERLGLPEGAYVVGGVGRLAAGKRFADIIGALAELPDRPPAVARRWRSRGAGAAARRERGGRGRPGAVHRRAALRTGRHPRPRPALPHLRDGRARLPVPGGGLRPGGRGGTGRRAACPVRLLPGGRGPAPGGRRGRPACTRRRGLLRARPRRGPRAGPTGPHAPRCRPPLRHHPQRRPAHGRVPPPPLPSIVRPRHTQEAPSTNPRTPAESPAPPPLARTRALALLVALVRHPRPTPARPRPRAASCSRSLPLLLLVRSRCPLVSLGGSISDFGTSSTTTSARIRRRPRSPRWRAAARTALIDFREVRPGAAVEQVYDRWRGPRRRVRDSVSWSRPAASTDRSAQTAPDCQGPAARQAPQARRPRRRTACRTRRRGGRGPAGHARTAPPPVAGPQGDHRATAAAVRRASGPLGRADGALGDAVVTEFRGGDVMAVDVTLLSRRWRAAISTAPILGCASGRRTSRRCC